jgi:hypothetical protein
MIPIAPNEKARQQQVVNWVNSLRITSENHYWTYRRQLPKIYNLYRGFRSGQYHVHKHKLSVPLLYTIIWSHAARIMNMVFGTTDPIRFIGASGSPEEAAIGRKFDSLFMAQWRDSKGVQKALDVLINANLYGTCPIQHGWKYEKSKILVPATDFAPLSEQTVATYIEREVINFDGPNFEIIDPLDALPQPGIKDIHDMDHFGRRYWLDFTQVKALSVPGGSREPLFDPKVVREMELTGTGATTALSSLKAMRGQGMWTADDETARLRERYSRPVEIVEYVGIETPTELLPADSTGTFRVLTVANGKFLLRDKTFPFLLSKRPYLACSLNPDPHYFFAPGRGEMAAQMQLGINKFTNQVLDALDVSIDPWFIFDRNAAVDPRNLFLRPGRWIPVTGNPQNVVMPGQVNLQGLSSGIETTQLLWQYMQRVSGILDESVIGVRAPGRSTARGDLSRAEAVAVRLVLEAMLFEQQILEPLADAYMAHDKQFLIPPKEYLILGNAMKTDPQTGSSISVERGTIYPKDLTGNYSAKAVGTQLRAIRSDRIQDFLLMTQIIGQSPSLAAAASSAGWIKLIAREMGLGHEVNELLSQNPQMAELLAAVGGDASKIPDLNMKEGSPGAVGNLNSLAGIVGAGA